MLVLAPGCPETCFSLFSVQLNAHTIGGVTSGVYCRGGLRGELWYISSGIFQQFSTRLPIRIALQGILTSMTGSCFLPDRSRDHSSRNGGAWFACLGLWELCENGRWEFEGVFRRTSSQTYMFSKTRLQCKTAIFAFWVYWGHIHIVKADCFLMPSINPSLCVFILYKWRCENFESWIINVF